MPMQLLQRPGRAARDATVGATAVVATTDNAVTEAADTAVALPLLPPTRSHRCSDVPSTAHVAADVVATAVLPLLLPSSP